MDKIKLRPLHTLKEALEASIEIWERLSESPDGTKKEDILESGYSCDCPLCDYVRSNCAICPISDCLEIGQPYITWADNKTKSNAKAVLKQLQDALKEINNDKA